MNVVLLVAGTGMIVMLASALRAGGREAKDVLDDLDGQGALIPGADDEAVEEGAATERVSAFQLLERDAQKRLKAKGKMITAAGAGIGAVFTVAMLEPDLPNLIIGAGGGLCLGYLVSKRIIASQKHNFVRQIEFFLPIIMERIVMAVQSGLDIIPAIERVLELDKRAREREKRGLGDEVDAEQDPVSRLLSIVCRLTNAGLSFEKSLREVAQSVPCPALRHAFIHLALAQEEGGELVSPLTELSDSTQLYYQESVEEEIAKMPFKATAPLLCTFAGLIVCFLTPPIIQVMNFGVDAVPK